MLERKDVYRLIEAEREYQDRNYQSSEVLSSSVTRGVRDLDVAPGILMLDIYVRKAQDAWANVKGDNTPALRQVAKVAAIAVRILERAGGSEVLVKEGLRVVSPEYDQQFPE